MFEVNHQLCCGNWNRNFRCRVKDVNHDYAGGLIVDQLRMVFLGTKFDQTSVVRAFRGMTLFVSMVRMSRLICYGLRG